MYEYSENKHACQTDITLYSLYIWRLIKWLAYYHNPWTVAIASINSASPTAEKC